MLNLDLSKSVAVRKVCEMAQAKGREEGLAKGRTEGVINGIQETILEAIDERFGRVPQWLSEQLRQVQQEDVLKMLLRQT